jgi:hypothetical protein
VEDINVNAKNNLLKVREQLTSVSTWIYEFIDNSIDALANNVALIVRSNAILVIDNGLGMNREELDKAANHMNQDIAKYKDKQKTGQYQEGLKVARVALAEYFYIITKKDNGITCVKGDTFTKGIFINYEDVPKYVREEFESHITDSGTCILLKDTLKHVIPEIWQNSKLEFDLSLTYAHLIKDLKLKLSLKDQTKYVTEIKSRDSISKTESSKIIPIYQEGLSVVFTEDLNEGMSPGLFFRKNGRLLNTKSFKSNLSLKKTYFKERQIIVDIQEDHLTEVQRGKFTVSPRKDEITFNIESDLYQILNKTIQKVLEDHHLELNTDFLDVPEEFINNPSSFEEAYKMSFVSAKLIGATSSKKLIPLHGFISTQLQLVHKDKDIYSIGYNEGKEKSLNTHTGMKDIDISILKDDKFIEVHEVKAPLSDYKKNENNALENLLGSLINTVGNPDNKNIKTSIIVIMREESPTAKKNTLGKNYILQQNTIDKYFKITDFSANNRNLLDSISFNVVDIKTENGTIPEKCPNFKKLCAEYSNAKTLKEKKSLFNKLMKVLVIKSSIKSDPYYLFKNESS